MKSLTTITLYDIMSEDLDVWVKRHKGYGFDMQIDDERGQLLLDEQHIHPFAIDALADFCRRYLASYGNALKQEVA